MFCIIYYPFILIYPPLIFKPSTFAFQNFPLYILFHFFIITLAQQNMESRGIKKESPDLAKRNVDKHIYIITLTRFFINDSFYLVLKKLCIPLPPGHPAPYPSFSGTSSRQTTVSTSSNSSWLRSTVR